MAKNIKTRQADYAQWYLDVIKAAQLADYSPVKGCMVIRPEGFAIWEAIQRDLDRRFKDLGHVNAYFPLLIPTSFLAKEAQHVEGFAMECALVTHTRLEKNPDKPGTLRPAPSSALEEPLVIRPTSETIIGHMYAEWVQSYRDLPILINQWCNVMRWEMRTRLFLRTAEFLWQEGHTAHETESEAIDETTRMLDVYAAFAEHTLALPVIKGTKTESEKFPGAVTTYCIEALMQDGKALQAGTSHNLGQNFSKAFDIKFAGRDQKTQHAWTTSWGVSTRLIGAMIMAHSDDEGLVLPPNVAPTVLAIVPIFRGDEEKRKVGEFIWKVVEELVGNDEIDRILDLRYGRGQGMTYTKSSTTGKITVPGDAREFDSHEDARNAILGVLKSPNDADIQKFIFNRETFQNIVIDWRDSRPGDKQYHWEQRGVPLRIEVGPRDVDADGFILKSRVDRSKTQLSRSVVSRAWLKQMLSDQQKALYNKAKAFRDANIRDAHSYEEMKKILNEQGGFVRAYFKENPAAEAKIKEQTKATVRCIPLDQPNTPGTCIYSGQQTTTQVLFAQAY